MEHFKNLDWSWNKFEQEKCHQPRVLNFDTINDHDVMSRTVNEIHKCVLPKNDFKFKSAVKQCSKKITNKAEVEVTDPRVHCRRFLSHFDIRDFGYASELNPAEQKAILDSLSLKITHNPTLIKKKGKIPNWTTKAAQCSLELTEKRKIEASHFNKCSEIYFYRHNTEFNNLIDTKMESFIINRWKKFHSSNSEEKFQAIAMLLRDQKYDGEIDVEFMDSTNKKPSKAFLISESCFPILDRLSVDDLTFYLNLEDTQNENASLDFVKDVSLSIDVLSTLLVDSDEFSLSFKNYEKVVGKMSSTLNNPLPLNPVSIAHSLEEIVKVTLNMSLKLVCMDRAMVLPNSNLDENFVAEPIQGFMRKRFNDFVKKYGANRSQTLWKIKSENCSFAVLVEHIKTYAMLVDGQLMLTNVSVKMEYQTNFGSEKMKKSELIKEWCVLKFNTPSITLRFRIDAETLKIVSITRVTIEEVEAELKEDHDTSFKDLLGNLFNIFSCLRRLPQGCYVMRGQLEDNCKKLLFYKPSDNGKIVDSTMELEKAFTRKWLPIDPATSTFLHLKHFFAPCCFPNVNIKHLPSYLPKTIEQKTVKRKTPCKKMRKVIFAKKNKA